MRGRHLLWWWLGMATGCATAPAVVPVATAPASQPGPVVARSPVPPDGFVEMYVAGVMPTSSGHTLFLHDQARSFFIPIGIGEGEALSIHLRMERRRFERPLTHDLLDATMRELGAHMDHVQIDALRSGVFVGAIYLRREDRLIVIDARPSDAVALALGSQVPIFVAQDVIDQAGIPANGEIQAPAVDPAPSSAPTDADAEALSL